MGLSAGWGRRHVLLAPYLALVLVLSGMVWYAVEADGYRTHDARLNDGGVWVTSSRDGFYGRVNKPIGQLDGALFARLDSFLDIVQDGAAVVGVDLSAGLISTIDPASVGVPAGEEASIPGGAAVQLSGGTLAVADPVTGKVWAQRTDPEVGLPIVSGLDRETPAVAEVGSAAALAVTTRGTVLAVSGDDDRLLRLRAREHDFAPAQRQELSSDVGDTVTLTAVGETAVVLDAEAGALSVPGVADADVVTGAVLQQPGPAADAVLVAAGDRLQLVDTATGEIDTVIEGLAGHPAAPVRLGDCLYGAWSGGRGTVLTRCGDEEPVVAALGAGTSDLVFRVNRGEILLNDRATGAVWNIDSEQPARLDDWESFKNKVVDSDENEENEKEDQGDRRPPEAKPDDVGARPGRTTVLHPLDNDTAPRGRILSIRSVQDVRGSDAEITISPDGQTVQIRMPEESGTTTFEYYVDDGRQDVSDHATVTVTPRADGENAAPQLRQGFEPREWTVPAGGVLDIPVLADWRDKADGDPLTVDSATALEGDTTGAVARTTSGGRVRFSAPAQGGLVSVAYFVSDGLGEPVEDELRIRVQDRRDRQAHPGVAEPDVVSGETGEPITIRPLGNDLPGSDPVIPDAELALAGKVVGTDGAEVTTNLVDGTLTFRSPVPKTYFLDYDAAYGNAPLDRGRIRVDVRAPQRPPLSPVAVPDNVTLYGQASSLVDVLANDVDPAGGLLVVQRATAVTDNQLDVAVVDGRWLRVSGRQGQLAPNPQLVRYTISNGEKSGVQGEVVVSQRPEPEDNTPVTAVDRATVRAGGGVSVPVLDNDFSPSGDALQLVGNVAGEVAGRLAVRAAGDEEVPVGSAYVAGRFVRYVAPAEVADAETFVVDYLATNARGQTAPGRTEITVIPGDRANELPEPPVLEGRAVSGDTVRLRLPGSGVDPDGDAVTLLGLGSAPALGRVVRLGANSLEYQAFPGSVGTDEFSYEVTDPFGGVASGTARVGVVPPGASQPPLAVADTVTVEPRRSVTVDVLANDHLAAGDRATIALVDPPAGARLESDTGPLVLESPAVADGRNLEVVYRIDNGIATSQATVTLRTVRPWNNPPVVFDAFGLEGGLEPTDAAVEDGDSVTVDVLATAYDPDGPTPALRVREVVAPAGVASSMDGPEITVARGAEPMVVPFVVEDADGGAATASLYVPALRPAAPYADPDALVRLEPGESVRARLSDLVVNPGDGPLSFTLKGRVWASPPGGVRASITGAGTLEVSAAEQYAGPGAVTFEVTTGSSVDDPDAVVAIVSVPVQVGDDAPILRCPDDPVPVAQGESVRLDVTALCHVWTPDPEDAADLSYDADWERSSDGLFIVQPSGPTITVSADGSVTPGSEGLLSVTTEGSAAGQIPIEVISTPPPSLSPLRIADMRAGESRTIDLARYLRPGVGNPVPTVLTVEQLTDLDVQVTTAGSGITLTTGPGVDGTAQFRIEMSDVAGDPPPGRRVEGRLALEILDRPDPPLAPVPGRTVRSAEVHLEWRRPEANGAPIDYYEVRSAGGGVQRCASTSCDITGLTNGRAHSFEVRAHNAVGWSDWSQRSAQATPDAKPGVVGPVRLVRVDDGTVTLRWTAPTTKTSRIRRYFVTWPGGEARTTTTTAVLRGLDNNNRYVFAVQAENALDVGPVRRSAPYQSVGEPGTPTAPRITDQQTAGDQGAVTLSWGAVGPNGPGPVRYTVLRNGAALPSCTDIVAARCDNAGITYDGTTYSFAVRASNAGVDAPGGEPRASQGPSSTWSAVGEPAAWGAWSVRPTGRDNVGAIDFSAPPSRGGRSTVHLVVNGSRTGKTWSVNRTGQRVRDTISTSVDGNVYDVRLDVCNEAGACSTSGSNPLQTYGDVGVGELRKSNGTVEDPTSSCTWPVNPNGRVVTVYIGDSARGTFGPGDGFSDANRTVTGHSQTMDCDLRVVTEAGVRPEVRREGGEATNPAPPPPPRSVSIQRGTRCQDGGSNPCNPGGSGQQCVNSSCGRIAITTANFTAPQASCDFFDSDEGYYSTRTVDTNTTDEPGAYFGYRNRQVWVVCDGVESNHYDWPDS